MPMFLNLKVKYTMVKVLKAGYYTSVQDLGRFGYREKGVPVSGVMDEQSAIFANKLLNNSANDAVLEITMTGPTLEFTEPTEIVITGATMQPALNGNPVGNYMRININKCDFLSFGSLKQGFRAYLAVKGGFLTENVLGSRSFYKPITAQNRLKDGDVLKINKLSQYHDASSHIHVQDFIDAKAPLKVLPGPEFHLFKTQISSMVIGKRFTISKNNNRMAYQLEEEGFKHEYSMLTSATMPGTVQLTPSGKIIILMKDAQTTGGYPRILQFTEGALRQLAQRKMGDSVTMELVFF